MQLVSEGNGMDPICMPNFVQARQIVDDVEGHTRLYGSDPGCNSLQLPEALRLGKESVVKSVRVPVFDAVRKLRVANLGS